MQLRHRIKAVETIKKITHAMRIISMSTHARLRSQQATLQEYKKKIGSIYLLIQKKMEADSVASPVELSDHTRTLLIIVSSQKGLCGNFNTNLFLFINYNYGDTLHDQTVDIITIGKKAHEYLPKEKKPIRSYDELSIATIGTISTALTAYVSNTASDYSDISFLSNKSKTFFNQKPEKKTIIPFTPPITEISPLENVEEYRWEQSPQELFDLCKQQMLTATIHELLLQSLLAEQAARFIAMDNSTRNAGNILDGMKLRYNKTRQTRITRELTDLASSL